MFLIDAKNKKAATLDKKTFSELKLSERYDLQEWIVDNPNILGESLLIIQKEFAGFSDTKERLDLLALDENGNLVIIENKLDDTGRDVTWQALKYVSYCATLTKAEICEIFQKYLGQTSLAEEKLCDFYNETDFENIRLNPSDGDQRIIFVAANFRKEVTSTVLWLRDHNVDIKCMKLTPYIHDSYLYLDTEQILPIQDIGDYQIKLSAKRQEDIVASSAETTRIRLNKEFWELALPTLRTKTGIYNNVSPSKDHWVNGASGYSGIQYNAVILSNGARAELYIDTGDKERNKLIFHKLYERKEAFNIKVGMEIDWQELPEKRACRLGILQNNSGLLDKEHWVDSINFLGDNIAKMINVFKLPLDEAIRDW